MRILHTSDWHLGRSLHRADLTPAFELWCRHVVDTVRERQVDAVLVSGDVYDRAVAPTSAVELFDRTLARLAQTATVIVTSGNHDSPQRLGFGSALMRENVHMRTDSRDCGRPIEVRDREGRLGALVYAIPYLDPDVERRRLRASPSRERGDGAQDRRAGEGAPCDPTACEEYLDRSHEAVLRAALDLVAADVFEGEHAGTDVARICMAHAFVTGGEATASERDIRVGGVDDAPSGLFRLGAEDAGPLSYVALGHLHSAQRVGLPDDPPMRYSGSPVAFSFSETAPKSSVLLHVEGRMVETELLPAPVWRPIVTLEGSLRELLDPGLSAHRAKFARLIVTDPARPPDMSARLLAAFPHALEIAHRPVERAIPDSVPLAAQDPIDVLAHFMEKAGNRQLDAHETGILREVWEAARRIHQSEATR